MNDSPPDSVTPERAEAKLTAEFFSIGRHLFDLIRPSGGHRYSAYVTEAGRRYFGHYRRHSTLFKGSDLHGRHEEVARPGTLPPFSELFGNLHRIYRELPRHIAVHLDTEKLRPETRALIEELDSCISEWQREVNKTGEKWPNGPYKRLPHYTLVPPAIQGNISTRTDTACQKLMDPQSELMTASSIPVRIGGKMSMYEGKRHLVGGESRPTRNSTHIMHDENKDYESSLGLYLYGLDIVSRYQLDLNLVPPRVQDFLVRLTYLGSKQLDHIRDTFESEPELKPVLEKACVRAHGEVTALLKAHPRPLQMANLIGDNDEFNGARQLLDIAGQEPYPDALVSPLECGLVLKAIEKYLPRQQGLHKLAEECLLAPEDQEYRLPDALVQPVKQFFARTAFDSSLLQDVRWDQRERVIQQVTLAEAYLDSPLRRVGRDSGVRGIS